MTKNIPSLFTVFLCFAYMLSYGQTSTLLYKTKGKSTYGVDIAFADERGNTSLQPSEYFNYSDMYFVLTPTSTSPKGYFKKDYVNDILSKIYLNQNEKTLNQSNPPEITFNEDDKIAKVIIAFSKEGFRNYKAFSFKVNEFHSKEINLREEYFQSFVPQNKNYEQGLKKLKEEDFIGAYTDFMKIVDAANMSFEIKTFSFYGPVIITNIPQAIKLFIQAELENFNLSNNAFQNEMTLRKLKTCEAIVESVSKKISIFNSYLILEGVNIAESRDQISSFLNTLNQQKNENISAFEQDKMLFFKQGDYNNYKFNLFIDLISKLLIHKNLISSINKIEPLNLNILNYYPESKRELMGDWEEQFKIFIDLINKNIDFYGYVFNKDVMDNLDSLRATQKQPYFEIISAFNSLNDDTDSFKLNLQTAIKKSSDESIIENIEYWLLSFRLTDEGINSAYITELNEGINLIRKEQFDRADDIFNLLMRIANQYAPVWYYTGLIKHNLGESFSAERFFAKALEVYPEYVAPRIFILKIFKNNKNYTQLLENTSIAIESLNTWTFRYKRASAFYKLDKFNEVIREITEECITLNSWDINQYFLLGDAYLAINNFEKAKEAYEKTLDINPFSSDTQSFDNRMKILYDKMGESENNYIEKETDITEPSSTEK